MIISKKKVSDYFTFFPRGCISKRIQTSQNLVLDEAIITFIIAHTEHQKFS